MSSSSLIPARSRSRSQSRSKRISQSRPLSRPKSRSSDSRIHSPELLSSHVVVSGLDEDDTSHLTDDKSSASNTLAAILNQIETYKDELNQPIDMSDAESFREGMANRSDAAALIEKLSVAVTAVRNLGAM